MYLEFAELRALKRKAMYMKDWVEKLDGFLRLSERDILTHSGTVSHDQALEKARIEYEKFSAERVAEPTNVERHFIDAEREVRLLEEKKNKANDKR